MVGLWPGHGPGPLRCSRPSSGGCSIRRRRARGVELGPQCPEAQALHRACSFDLFFTASPSVATHVQVAVRRYAGSGVDAAGAGVEPEWKAAAARLERSGPAATDGHLSVAPRGWGAEVVGEPLLVLGRQRSISSQSLALKRLEESTQQARAPLFLCELGASFLGASSLSAWRGWRTRSRRGPPASSSRSSLRRTSSSSRRTARRPTLRWCPTGRSPGLPTPSGLYCSRRGRRVWRRSGWTRGASASPASTSTRTFARSSRTSCGRSAP